MTVDELSWFIVLAETEHMTDASVRLNITQPTLSRALTRWERQLGAPLFDRVNRRLRLNANGEILLAHARRCVEELTAAGDRIAALNDPDQGLIRLVFLHSAATWLVPNLLRRYRAEFPAVRFELRQAAGHEIPDTLHDHLADLAVTSPRPDSTDFAWHTLAREQLCLAVPRTHRLARRRTLALADADGEQFIALGPEFGLRRLADELCDAAGIEPEIAFESMEISSMEGLVGAGFGVAIVPSPRPDRAEPEVTYVPLRDGGAQRVIGLAWLKASALAPVAQRFVEFVVSGRWS
ncbi:MAG TPA: LysR substrate-binding domain-containing protein [Pseudonocardiaceae bacterium]